MSDKTRFTTKARGMASTFSNLADDILALQNVYFDRGYSSGGADELTDQDIADTGVTAEDVTGMVTFAAALETFLVATRGYLSAMRDDV